MRQSRAFLECNMSTVLYPGVPPMQPLLVRSDAAAPNHFVLCEIAGVLDLLSHPWMRSDIALCVTGPNAVNIFDPRALEPLLLGCAIAVPVCSLLSECKTISIHTWRCEPFASTSDSSQQSSAASAVCPTPRPQDCGIIVFAWVVHCLLKPAVPLHHVRLSPAATLRAHLANCIRAGQLSIFPHTVVVSSDKQGLVNITLRREDNSVTIRAPNCASRMYCPSVTYFTSVLMGVLRIY